MTDVRKERMLRDEQCVRGIFFQETWQAMFLRKQAVNNREEGGASTFSLRFCTTTIYQFHP